MSLEYTEGKIMGKYRCPRKIAQENNVILCTGQQGQPQALEYCKEGLALQHLADTGTTTIMCLEKYSWVYALNELITKNCLIWLPKALREIQPKNS